MWGVARLGTGVAALAIALAGCSGGDSADGPSESPQATATDVTTINGKPLTDRMLPLQHQKVMLDTIDADGNRLLVVKAVRMPHTRVAIHTHKYGGHTCILKGVMTDYVQGREPMKWPAGTCYYMPPNTLMSADNRGNKKVVLIDTFVLPPGEPEITIREPGWPGTPLASDDG